ncbi:MAG: GNAT family N-acetyltransferase [Pseudomonadota bacterium]
MSLATDVEVIAQVINDAAQAYQGVIPADRWHVPYMGIAELESEIADGVRFRTLSVAKEVVAVMGIQDRGEVHLLRHAYVRTKHQGRGLGTRLLRELRQQTTTPILVGTWKAASWAVRFYQRHGFRVMDDATAERLLKTYWQIPQRQIETSVVLASADFQSI